MHAAIKPADLKSKWHTWQSTRCAMPVNVMASLNSIIAEGSTFQRYANAASNKLKGGSFSFTPRESWRRPSHTMLHRLRTEFLHGGMGV